MNLSRATLSVIEMRRLMSFGLFFAASLSCAAQNSLCADLSKSVNYAKQGFQSIKGSHSQFDDSGTIFKSTFNIASVTDDCKVGFPEDQPKAGYLSCSRKFSAPLKMSADEAEEESQAYYESLSKEVQACISSAFPDAEFKRPSTYGGADRFTASGLGQTEDGFDIEVEVEHSCSSRFPSRLGVRQLCTAGVKISLR